MKLYDHDHMSSNKIKYSHSKSAVSIRMCIVRVVSTGSGVIVNLSPSVPVNTAQVITFLRSDM